ncbi:hypothetical protein HYDPIDRAFT_115641 [Hydnomerulius pinastri MD-312]|uniref:Uncharacterized protein n=1 Tax=Hydnomerulius pinastri MD-312 TaxID=994086 RepID=A0A0C9WCP4_9AGAM|nr:hypothetical protein HYDPIDRAFT_115641 [Hydnomerulius pinastri MD-312]
MNLHHHNAHRRTTPSTKRNPPSLRSETVDSGQGKWARSPPSTRAARGGSIHDNSDKRMNSEKSVFHTSSSKWVISTVLSPCKTRVKVQTTQTAR